MIARSDDKTPFTLSPALCGIDEAGRGPLAGPVVAAAVVLPENAAADSPVYAMIELLDDSKRVPERRRRLLSREIRRYALDYATGWVWPAEIDTLNIYWATMLAMKRAYSALKHAARSVVVDGNAVPDIPGAEVVAVVGGDRSVKPIMAASILAKTARDAWMVSYATFDPRYAFEQHKGYPTREHKRRIAEYGPCPIHRRSFRGVTAPSADPT